METKEMKRTAQWKGSFNGQLWGCLRRLHSLLLKLFVA